MVENNREIKYLKISYFTLKRKNLHDEDSYRLSNPSSNFSLKVSFSTFINIIKFPLLFTITSSFATSAQIHFLGLTFSLMAVLVGQKNQL